MSETTNEITAEQLEGFHHDIKGQLQWLWLGMEGVSNEAKAKLNLLEVQRHLEKAIDAIGDNEDE